MYQRCVLHDKCCEHMGRFDCGSRNRAVITWWVYFRQKMISKQQDDLLEKVKELVEKNVNLEESQEKMLKSIEEFQKHHETVLNQILQLDKKIDNLLKK